MGYLENLRRALKRTGTEGNDAYRERADTYGAGDGARDQARKERDYAKGSERRATTIRELRQSLRIVHEQLLDAAQNDEMRQHRLELYVQYAGLAKAEMWFWQMMVDTGGLITARHGVGFTDVY